MMKSFLELVPREDLTHLIFWDKHVLTELDSEILRTQIRDTFAYYKSIFDLLTKDPDSPYHAKNSITLEEFLWAFSIVSSRHVIFNN